MTDIRRKLILIADDFDHAAELLADLVEHKTSHEAVSAKDGRRRLRALRSAAPMRQCSTKSDSDFPLFNALRSHRGRGPLPTQVFPSERLAVARNRYSVPCELAGQMVSTRLYTGEVAVGR
jgi:hypothetical protein